MKRLTKEQKRATEIAAIRARLVDICLGAYGPYGYPEIDTDDRLSISGQLGIEAFARYVGGIRNAFQFPGQEKTERERPWHTDLSSLDKLDTLDSAAEYLWNRGVRALAAMRPSGPCAGSTG